MGRYGQQREFSSYKGKTLRMSKTTKIAMRKEFFLSQVYLSRHYCSNHV